MELLKNKSIKNDFRRMEHKVKSNQSKNFKAMKNMENEYDEMKMRVDDKLAIIRKR